MITYRTPIALDIPVLASYEKDLFPYSPWSTAQFKEEFAGIPKTRFMLVAESENRIVGYCAIFLPGAKAAADVLTVAVLPEFRRQGIARELMHQMELWATERGAASVMLEVETFNESAIALYQALGYSQISTRANYYGFGQDAHVMAKEL